MSKQIVLRDDFANRQRKEEEGGSGYVCARKEGGRGEGTTNEEVRYCYLVSERTAKWYTRKEKGETGDPGQRSRESK